MTSSFARKVFETAVKRSSDGDKTLVADYLTHSYGTADSSPPQHEAVSVEEREGGIIGPKDPSGCPTGGTTSATDGFIHGLLEIHNKPGLERILPNGEPPMVGAD